MEENTELIISLLQAVGYQTLSVISIIALFIIAYYIIKFIFKKIFSTFCRLTK